jgi:hypothetical protein|tara:strand:- start:902 stop:1045 length:144 start_codon:yes stop_codon:yes gene_type:complete
MDKYIYKALEVIGDAIQWAFDFVDSNSKEVTWFSIGVISILIVQFIF